VREATSNEQWAASSSQMAQIAKATFDYSQYPKVFAMLWKRVKDYEVHLHVQKALIVVDYLLRNGADRFVEDCRRHRQDVSQLRRYRYFDSSNRDVGGSIRARAKAIYELLGNNDKLQEARGKAEKLKGVASSHVSSAGSGRGHHSSGRAASRPTPGASFGSGRGGSQRGSARGQTSPPNSNTRSADPYDLYSHTAQSLTVDEQRRQQKARSKAKAEAIAAADAAEHSSSRKKSKKHKKHKQSKTDKSSRSAAPQDNPFDDDGADPFADDDIRPPSGRGATHKPKKHKKSKKQKKKSASASADPFGSDNDDDIFGDDEPAKPAANNNNLADDLFGTPSASQQYEQRATSNNGASASGAVDPFDLLTGGVEAMAVSGDQSWENSFNPDSKNGDDDDNIIPGGGRVEWAADVSSSDDDDEDEAQNGVDPTDPWAGLVNLDAPTNQPPPRKQSTKKSSKKKASMAEMMSKRPSIVMGQAIPGFESPATGAGVGAPGPAAAAGSDPSTDVFFGGPAAPARRTNAMPDPFAGAMPPQQPGYGAPAPGYGYPAPAPGYGAPAPGYGAPAPGYGAPAPGYGYPAPAPGYGYGAPQPQPGYGAPVPQPGYGQQRQQPAAHDPFGDLH
jgi:ENTH domain